MATPIIGLIATLGANESGGNVDFLNPVTITIPDYEVGSVETTSLASTGGVRTFIPGLKDPGKFDFSMLYTSTDYARLNALKGVTKTWKTIIPTDGTATETVSGLGFLTKHSLEIEADKAIMIKGEVKMTGNISVT